MKTFYISHGSNILIDKETNECNRVTSERQAIDSIYLVNEPMHIVYGYGDERKEVDADANDIIITFYTDEFKTRMVVVKNDEWVENIKVYNQKRQEEKERWAESQNCKCDCESISR